MAKPNTYWFYNHTTNNVVKAAGSGSDANFKPITTGTGASGFTLAWTGSNAADGAPTGTRDTITIPGSGSVEIDKTFIDDGSIVDQVPLAGTNQGKQQGGDTRYVFCIHIAGATQSKAFLEFWDNANHNSFSNQVLGSGMAGSSYIYGSATTYASPGSSDWSGGAKRLAGSGPDNRLELSSANIPSGGADLYFNLATRVPATASPFSENPLCALRFSYA
ncbi:MAG: hypothetical protein Q6354_09295 [Candidatus Brocadiales bacterium]|nr:hypothetical protein [Candidatus Brocadiales bacterium]